MLRSMTDEIRSAADAAFRADAARAEGPRHPDVDTVDDTHTRLTSLRKGSAGPTVLETERLILRRWMVSDAAMQRRLWAERDPRVPPHRRLSADGHPTTADLADRIRREDTGSGWNLLAAVRKETGGFVGYCGLIENTHGPAHEPELAYELLREEWGKGLATEAAREVILWAESLGCTRVWATIREWNTASRRVASKLGFVETSRTEPDAEYGDSLFYRKDLRAGR